MVVKKFKTESGKEYTLKCSITEFLALKTVLSTTDLKRCEESFKFVFEHVYSDIAGVETAIKTAGSDTFLPATLNDDLAELEDIYIKVVVNVMMPAFQKSNESK